MTLRTNDHDDWLWDNDLGWTVTLIHTRSDPPPPPPTPKTVPNLAVPLIETVQSIQSWNNSVPLIAGKRTVVRVYVDSGIRNGHDAGWGPNAWLVTGSLELVDATDGSAVATRPQPTLGSVTVLARPAADIDRERLDHSLNFELPPEAIHRPSLRIQTTITDPVAPWHATQNSTVQFVPRAQQPVLPILINLETNAVGPPTMAEFTAALIDRALPRYPVAEDGFLIHPQFNWTTRNDLSDKGAWGGLLSQIQTIKLLSSTPVDGIRCGVVSDTPGGWGYNGLAHPRIWGSRVPGFIANVARPTTFAHEMAHTFGVWHSNCKGTEELLDSRKIPGRTDEIGFQTNSGTIVGRGRPELMGYCDGDRWPAVKTYEILAGEGAI